MMLFKLSLKNIKQSFKDYAIYFITLVLGVSIFYMFNSLETSQAMMQVSNSTREIIKLMINLLGFVSVFVAIVLGLLIVYANNFLIKRRKREFGIYMILGMGKRQISKIILLETIFVGIISLAVGLIIGIFASQFMSILVAKLFEADMSEFKLIFSQAACIKTCIYFAVMYLAVMVFNTISISRYKLINLLTAIKKNEEIKIKNPIISILVFIVATIMLGYAYWKVTKGANTLNSDEKLLGIILLGSSATFLVFWSLSGFLLRIIQAMKKVYLKDTNMFVLRQINNKINTMVVSMTVICLMLFMTISILSSSLSLRNTMGKELKEMTPVDINLYKTMNLPERYVNRYGKEIVYTKEEIADSNITIQETLQNNDFDINLLKDIVEIPIYTINELTLEKFFESKLEDIKAKFPMIAYDTQEEIVKVSDYNKVASSYGLEQYELKDDEYIMLCNFDSIKDIRDLVLKDGNKLQIVGKEYISKYNECKPGFIKMSTSHTNTGIILVPDSCNLTDNMKEQTLLIANYNADTDEKREELEEFIVENGSGAIARINENGSRIDGLSKISIIQSSVGLATIVTFIAIYLGIIFLIASSAILALKQLTESSDNKQRYVVLRRIGCDEKIINKSLFRQIGIFFAFPLILAIIHSIFGIQFVLSMMSSLANPSELLPSVMVTVIIIGVVYGVYFIATYMRSKSIIKEN